VVVVIVVAAAAAVVVHHHYKISKWVNHPMIKLFLFLPTFPQTLLLLYPFKLLQSQYIYKRQVLHFTLFNNAVSNSDYTASNDSIAANNALKRICKEVIMD
jgi:hypothetical protein